MTVDLSVVSWAVDICNRHPYLGISDTEGALGRIYALILRSECKFSGGVRDFVWP